MNEQDKKEYIQLLSDLETYVSFDEKMQSKLEYELTLKSGKPVKLPIYYTERLEVSGLHIKHTVYDERQVKGFLRNKDSVIAALESRLGSLEIRKELDSDINDYREKFPDATENNTEAVNLLLSIIEKYSDVLKTREDNEQRRISEFKNLINANWDVWTHFTTLTFQENVTDIDFAQKIFKKWVRKMESLFSGFVYCAVKEFQQRGAIHFHVLVGLGIKRIPKQDFLKVRNFWTELDDSVGNIDIKGIKTVYVPVEYQDPEEWKKKEVRHIWSLGNYLTSYLKKGASDPRLFGRKLFTSSSKKKLKQKIVITDKEKIHQFLRTIEIDGLKKKSYKVKERIINDDNQVVKGSNDIGEMHFYNLLIKNTD